MLEIEKYLEESGQLETENAVNRLLGQIEGRLTYQELLEFKFQLERLSEASRWSEAEQFWLERLKRKLSFMPENVRHDFSFVEDASIFKQFSSNTTGPRKLLVCFTGVFGGLMIPSWVFIAHLPLPITDVLIIDSPRNFGSEEHVRFRNEWADIVQKYRQLELSLKPFETFVYGVSGGTAAAALFSKSYNVSKVMFVGAASLKSERILQINPTLDISYLQRNSTVEKQAHFFVGLKDLKALRQLPNFFRLYQHRSYRFSLYGGHGVIAHYFRTKRLHKVLSWFDSDINLPA